MENKIERNDMCAPLKIIKLHQFIEEWACDLSNMWRYITVKNAFTRKRIITFYRIKLFILDLSRTSIYSRFCVYCEKILNVGVNVKRQSVCDARDKFNHLPFFDMFVGMVKFLYSSEYVNDLKKFNGAYNLIGIDGTKFYAPKNKETEKKFEKCGSENKVMIGSNLAIDLLNNYLLHATVTKGCFNERTGLKENIDFLCNELPHIAENSIIVTDSGYPSLEIMEFLLNRQLKFVIRCSKTFNNEVKEASLGITDVILKNKINVRIVKFLGNNDEEVCILTNLFDMSQEDIKSIFRLRWGVETMIRTMKHQLNIENFSGEKVNTILQDFWASMVLLNLALTYKEEADKIIQANDAEKDNMHEYQACMSEIFRTLKNKFIVAVFQGDVDKLRSEIQDVMIKITSVKSAKDPNRHFARGNTKAKPVTYYKKDT